MTLKFMSTYMGDRISGEMREFQHQRWKAPNHNTQIANKFQIAITNDRNSGPKCLSAAGGLNFGHWGYLLFVI
jgi:hypothetical protein